MYYIITRNVEPGFHQWPEAPEYCEYLRSRHRHEFVITCKFKEEHCNRDIEIIHRQEQIHTYLCQMYGIDNMNIDIGDMSCEMLARKIAEHFDAFEVTVQEDGAGGAGYVRQ